MNTTTSLDRGRVGDEEPDDALELSYMGDDAEGTNVRPVDRKADNFRSQDLSDLAVDNLDQVDPEILGLAGLRMDDPEVYGDIRDVKARIFGIDWAQMFIEESVNSADGGLNVDDMHASELVLDDGAGISPLRAVSGVSSGFQVRTENGMRSWSHSAPKVTPPRGQIEERSADLAGIMYKRAQRDAAREAARARAQRDAAVREGTPGEYKVNRVVG